MGRQGNHPFLVCFGDSLTAGYQADHSGRIRQPDCPYGIFLQEWLGPERPVVISGICGEVTQAMLQRFPSDVLARQPNFTVILGGTNDLGWGMAPPEIHRNVRSMYEMALHRHIHPVGVTVPSIHVEETASAVTPDSLPAWLRDHLDRRIVLNQLIRDTCVALGIPCVDLFTATADGSLHLLAAQFSSDGLHLNTEGYREFANLVWKEVFA